MKKTINVYEFRREFQNSDSYRNSLSHDGLAALFEYLEQYEEDTGEEIELDIVSLVCDYTEYDNALEVIEQYSPDMLPMSEDEAMTYLEERTTVIPFTGSRYNRESGEWEEKKGLIIANY